MNPSSPVSIRITRAFPVAADAVFQAWLDPAWIGRWMFGQPERDEQIVSLSVDARVGGRFSFVVARAGQRIEHVGEYREIVRPTRLVFTWGVAPDTGEDSVVTVEIEPQSSGCQLTLVHGLAARWSEYAARTEHGWTTMLVWLERALIRHPAGVWLEPASVRYVRRLPGPIERVWSYLTESELRGRWLAPGPMELRPGGKVELRFRHADLSPHAEATPEAYRDYEGGVTNHGSVLECHPPRRLSLLWNEESGSPSEVTFELEPQGDHVQLVLTHRRLVDRNERISVASGWHTHLAILAAQLQGEVPPPFWSTHADHEAYYRAQLGEPT